SRVFASSVPRVPRVAANDTPSQEVIAKLHDLLFRRFAKDVETTSFIDTNVRLALGLVRRETPQRQWNSRPSKLSLTRATRQTRRHAASNGRTTGSRSKT